MAARNDFSISALRLPKDTGEPSHEGTWGIHYLRGCDCKRLRPTLPRQDCRSYRAKIVVHQDKPELSVLDLDAEALRASLVARPQDLPEEPDAKS
jgi:hypothetical protein